MWNYKEYDGQLHTYIITKLFVGARSYRHQPFGGTKQGEALAANSLPFVSGSTSSTHIPKRTLYFIFTCAGMKFVRGLENLQLDVHSLECRKSHAIGADPFPLRLLHQAPVFQRTPLAVSLAGFGRLLSSTS